MSVIETLEQELAKQREFLDTLEKELTELREFKKQWDERSNEFDESTAKARANAFVEKCTDCGNVPSRTYRVYMAGQRAQHKAMISPVPEIKSLVEDWLETYQRDSQSIYNQGAAKVANKVLRIIIDGLKPEPDQFSNSEYWRKNE